MSYPTTLPINRASRTQREGGFNAVRATNGVLKVRRLYSVEKTDFTLEHWLTDAQKATLESVYSANRLLNITLTWPEDGVVYSVRFGAAPQYRKEAGYWVADVLLLQV